VARILRTQIFAGRLKPGEPLPERLLAEQLGVSRTPVREALHRLQAEGLVQILHNRGAMVVGWTARDLDDMYDLRVMLEDPAITVRRRLVEITESGDTLRWRDADGAETERREFILSPAGRDEFTRARRNADGVYWKEPGVVLGFEISGGRATGFEVESEDGTVVARATRVR